ncbi:cytidine deaminase-like protein [Sparassis latifolia]
MATSVVLGTLRRFSSGALDTSRVSGDSDHDDSGIDFESELTVDGNSDVILPENDLPFIRTKPVFEYEEDELSSIRTESAWVVDIPDPKQTTVLLKWLKESGLESPSMAHLKRIRRTDSKITIILAFASSSPGPPALPEDAELPAPYLVNVPCSAALTSTSLKLKSSLWPTLYTPPRKGELEDWPRGKVKWAFEAMRRVVREARQAHEQGEFPIAVYVPIPYDEETRVVSQISRPFMAHDTRKSSGHPLRHSVLNLIRAVADYRTSSTPVNQTPPDAGLDSDSGLTDSAPHNGAHYLLTSLTLFITHEPCIMCSMALLHSRAKEIFYLVPMAGTGGCGGAACVPMLQGVNHRFGIGRWKVTREWVEKYNLVIDQAVDI